MKAYLDFAQRHERHGGRLLVEVPALTMRLTPALMLWAWGPWGTPLALLGWLGLSIIDYLGKALVTELDKEGANQ